MFIYTQILCIQNIKKLKHLFHIVSDNGILVSALHPKTGDP